MNIQTLKTNLESKNLLKPSLIGRMRGFSLLEMAMVLAIIGLVMGTILSMTKTLTTSSKIAATQSKEALIKAALINFIATNNRLPCPADPTATASTAGTLSTPPGTLGTETVTAATPKGCGMPLNTNVYAGVVPWVTLGLTQDAATDGYNQFFTYLVAATAIQTVPVAAITALNAGLVPTISGLKGAISIYSSSALTTQINNCGPTVTYNSCAAVVAIISHGADGYGAYTSSGSAIPFPQFPDENQNAVHSNQIVMHDFAMTPTNPFDDIILLMTSSDLLTPLSANGAVQPYNALLNNEFANINATIATAMLTTRAGGSSPFTYNTVTSTSNNTNGNITPSSSVLYGLMPASITYDPWGNQIIYSTFAGPTPPATPASINCTLPSYSKALYSLTSKGPNGILDGVPPAGDDISITVYFNQLVPTFQNVNGGC